MTPPPPGSLPDFELSELRLSPRFSTVDLGEVKSVRLKVDVHGVHTHTQQQTHRSAPAPRLQKQWKEMSVTVVSVFFCFVSLNSVTDTSTKGESSVRASFSPTGHRATKTLPPGRHPPPLSSRPCTKHSITSAAWHPTDTLTYFPTSSHCTLSSWEHKNKDDTE